ncbi:hypothetical protein KOW79_002342 [Hemibagrus wyckioides]|uniref:Immunoglobulin domain-containing protein n=1 Tax=Hemibagrus wyckioides TaxID=337641 RepID=A0A9D3SSX8_9TELE|nr:hypothetical protein KOW79_002342 [Hemibagrus wyckioides]
MLLSWLLTLTVALALPLKGLGATEQKQVQLGKSVVLRCNISLHHEIFWLRVNRLERPRLLMVARLKNDGDFTEIWNYDSTHYEGCLVDKFIGLRILNVLINDLGSYYCGIAEGKRMEFEDGVHIYADMRDEKVTNYKEDIPIRPRVPEKRQSLYPVFASILGAGLLLMVLVVFIVQMITCS